MERTGYGTEIERIVKKIPYEEVIRSEDVADRLMKKFPITIEKAKKITNVKLKRMADMGNLKRMRKGVYCHVKQTIFGPVSPNIDQLMMKSLTVKDGVRIGYESGASLLNRIGLSSVIPRSIEVTTNQSGAQLPEGCHLKVKKPAAMVTDENWKYLQFIDAAGDLPEIDAVVDAEKPEKLLWALAERQKLDPLTLIFTARRYYSSKIVLRLTDLLMEANYETASGQERL